MTESMIDKEEKKSSLFPCKQLAHLHAIHYRDLNSGNIEIWYMDMSITKNIQKLIWTVDVHPDISLQQ